MALRLCSPYVVRLLVPARVAYPTVSPALPLLVQQTRGAARRGTREKRKRAHKKKEVEKQKWIPKAEIAAQIERLREKPSQRFQCHGVWPPSDDIYVSTFYRPYSYTLKEALEMLRENWHPTTGDRPNYMVTVNLELDMRLPKKSAGAMQRYMSTIRSLVDLPHMIPSGEDSRSVLAFVKSEEGRQEALAAGADLVGTMNTIKEISSGKLDFHNFDYIVAHPDILPDMVAVRGLLRKKFPQKKDGSLTADIGAGVRKFKYGLSIESKEEESEPSYGVIESPIGPLTLTDEELDRNLRALVETVMDFKPPESELIFLRHILLLSRPLKEVFRVTPSAYTSEKEDAFDEYVRLRAEEREAQAARQREIFALDNKKLKKKDFWDNYIFKLYYQNVSRKFKW